MFVRHEQLMPKKNHANFQVFRSCRSQTANTQTWASNSRKWAAMQKVATRKAIRSKIRFLFLISRSF